MKSIVLPFVFLLFLSTGCETSNQRSKKYKSSKIGFVKNNQFTRAAKWNRDSTYFELTYKGPEFTRLGKYYRDEAHLTSTRFTHILGPFLKSNFQRKNYFKLDLSSLKVSFKGDPEFRYKSEKHIEFKISVPLLRVTKRKYAMTSVEHKGTWVRDYKKCSDVNFTNWKERVAKISESEVEAKLIQKNGFREMWLQWRKKGI
jgi:hypothetical protein